MGIIYIGVKFRSNASLHWTWHRSDTWRFFNTCHVYITSRTLNTSQIWYYIYGLFSFAKRLVKLIRLDLIWYYLFNIRAIKRWEIWGWGYNDNRKESRPWCGNCLDMTMKFDGGHHALDLWLTLHHYFLKK